MSKTKPHFKLRVKERSDDGRQGTVGAAWLSADGHLNIQLNPGVVLSWKDDLYISLFPDGVEVESQMRAAHAVLRALPKEEK